MFLTLGVMMALVLGTLLLNCSSGTTVCFFAGIAVSVALGVYALRFVGQAKDAALAFTGLPVSARAWIPIFSVVDFDYWISKRAAPHWPKGYQHARNADLWDSRDDRWYESHQGKLE